MIVLSRLNGGAVALNPDLIERAEANPDTVISMLDGTKYVVAEALETVIDRVRLYRASIVALSQRLDFELVDQPNLRLVHDATEEG